MKELLGSYVKESILLYLGMRGGSSGRRLARVLGISSTQIFKALQQLAAARIVKRYGRSLYTLNSNYRHHDSLIRMIQKEAQSHPSKVRSFLPVISLERHVDPLAVYKFLSLRSPVAERSRLSDILRERYG